MNTKLTLIALLLIGAIACEKQLITFSNQACEQKAVAMTASALGSNDNINMLEEVGVMIVDIDAERLSSALLANVELYNCVKSVSKNDIATVNPIRTPANVDRKQWQLKRTNVHDLPLPKSYTRHESTNEVHVYVVDSGIDGQHNDLKSRVAEESAHKDFTWRGDSPLTDENDHGTHCAGLIASPEAGYNTHATLHSAKVFDASGSASFEIILNAMNWTITQHKNYPGTAGIVSMSLGGPRNDATNQAADRIRKAGLLPIVAAGNENQNTRNVSPGSAEGSYTVGASDIDDSRAYFSNFGTDVNIYAPGVQIWSCKPGNSYQYLSGTSMATPFVAGFASYLAASNKLTDAEDIAAALNTHVTKDHVSSAKEGTNALPFDGDASFVEEFLKFLSKN